MIRKNFLLIVCFLSSIVGLALIYIAAINIQPVEMKISEINFQLVGRTVKTTGFIVYKSSHPAGHLFLTISDNKTKVQVPLFAGFMNKLNERGIKEKDFKKGIKLSVSGLVEEYKGQLQIIPRKVEDIKILG